MACRFIKKETLWHSCFPANYAKNLRTPFLQSTSGRLLLLIAISFYVGCFQSLQWARTASKDSNLIRGLPFLRSIIPPPFWLWSTQISVSKFVIMSVEQTFKMFNFFRVKIDTVFVKIAYFFELLIIYSEKIIFPAYFFRCLFSFCLSTFYLSLRTITFETDTSCASLFNLVFSQLLTHQICWDW